MSPSKSIYRTTSVQRLWCLLLLCTTCPSPCYVAAFSWTCGLGFLPVENIPLSPAQQELFQNKAGDGERNLRSWGSANDAIAMPRDHMQRRTEEGALFDDGGNNTFPDDAPEKNNDNNGEEAEPIMYLEGRICACATGMLETDDVYYCLTPSDHCHIWRRRYGTEHKVTCFEEKDWKVGVARNMWYYLCFALFLLVLYPIFSKPGQHAVRYLLSKCFPKMNPWITEHILEIEMESNSLMREDFDYAARLKRQTEGWISGYSLKTKVYASGNVVSAEDNAACNGINDDNDTKFSRDDDINSGGAGIRRETMQDECNMENEEDNMCTICLLTIEDGERIAHLSCGHLYHSECLSEWILKKNSCPLCQDPDIAKPIRSFETEDDAAAAGGNNNDSGSKSIIHRLHSHVRESILDVATGRGRREYENRRLRMRLAIAALNDDSS